NCPKVKELYCYNNQLTSLDVSQIKDSLRVFSYRHNKFLPEEQAKLDDLLLPESSTKTPPNIPAQERLDRRYSQEERVNVTELDISGLGLTGELDLTEFVNLEKLDCSDNQLTGLDLRNCEKLEILDSSCNEINELSVDDNLELVQLLCFNNNLEELNVKSNEKLKTLICSQNELTELSVNPEINFLDCSNNLLENLELGECLELQTLRFHNNYIFYIDLENCQQLEHVYCYGNQLQEISVKNLKNLKELYCAHQMDDTMDEEFEDHLTLRKLCLQGCHSLEELDCAENRINEIDISNLKSLRFVSCRENHYSLRKESNADCFLKVVGCENLEYLDCTRNYFLESLDFSGCKKLRVLLASKCRIKDIKFDKEGYESINELDISNNNLGNLNLDEVLQNFPNLEKLSYDLLKLNEKELEGVPDELKEKLLELINKKQEEKFADELRKEGLHIPGDELPRKRKKQNPSPTQEPPELPTPQDIPTTLNNEPESDYKKLYDELLTEVEKLKNSSGDQQAKEIAEIREKIINSSLSESDKQKLLRMLEQQTRTTSKYQPKPTSYTP
ncbi:9163_t:CDS:2, partial [Racocetra persica]